MDYDEFIGSFAYDSFLDMSASSIALCLSAITEIQFRYNWSKGGNELSDAEWDYIESIIAIATKELMTSLVGMIVPHAMATISAFKMLPCDGSVHNKADYPLLYDAIDATYIISGTQFRVPDMRDRVPVGSGGTYALDDTFGVNEHALTIDEIPSHSHSYQRATFNVDVESVGAPDPTGVGEPPILLQTSSQGGDQPHENRQPSLVVKFAIIAG